MSSNKHDEMDLPLASTPAPCGLPENVISKIDQVVEKMKSIILENPDKSIQKYAIDTLNDATMVYLRDVYNYHDYPLPPWMIQTQEQTTKGIKHDSDNDMDGDYEDSELETPARKKTRRVSYPSAKRFGDGHPSPEGKLPAILSTRKAKFEKARLREQLAEGSTQPEDLIVKLLVPITTMRTLDQEQERLILLYFTLINLAKVIKKGIHDQSYTLPSDYAIEIVNFFFGVVFHSSGVTMVELIVKESSRSVDWKGFESPGRYSSLITTHEVIRQMHTVQKAEEYISGNPKKSRLRALRSLEVSIDFYKAYDRCCEFLKGDIPDAKLIAYMEKEGFGAAKSVSLKSRFHSMIAKQFRIDRKTLPKKVLGGLFLYHLVLVFGRGVLLLLQDNALRLWTEVIPKGLIPEILALVSGDFPELTNVCQKLEYNVSDKIKMEIVPTITFKYDAQSFASIFMAAGISSVDELAECFQEAKEADPSGHMAELLNWARWMDPGSKTTM